MTVVIYQPINWQHTLKLKSERSEVRYRSTEYVQLGRVSFYLERLTSYRSILLLVGVVIYAFTARYLSQSG